MKWLLSFCFVASILKIATPLQISVTPRAELTAGQKKNVTTYGSGTYFIICLIHDVSQNGVNKKNLYKPTEMNFLTKNSCRKLS